MARTLMHPPTKLSYDVASALIVGQRDQQEDAIIADFPLGGEMGFAVLADGMGGHAAGDIASKIVVTEMFSELKFQSGDPTTFEGNIPDILRDAAATANACLRHHTDHHPNAQGMGTTLVAPVLIRDKLYWVSIGDSPLFLYRDRTLSQLNEDHSLAGQIDALVEKGLMASDMAENHPDRHCLTSVLSGSRIPRVDCPSTPVALCPGDVVLVASDGLQFLDDCEIAGLIQETAHLSSAQITRSLIRALDALDDPHQDNVSICVIKVAQAHTVATHPAPDLAATEEAIRAILPSEHAETEGTAPPPQIAAQTDVQRGSRITVVARKTIDGLSMLCHVKRAEEKSA